MSEGNAAVEAITAAIQKADDSFGYSFNMTKLVDGIATHTLAMDGFDPVDFEDREDGYRLIEQRRNRVRADAVLAALSTSDETARLREYHAAVEELVCVWRDTDNPSSMDEDAWEDPQEDDDRWARFTAARAALQSQDISS